MNPHQLNAITAWFDRFVAAFRAATPAEQRGFGYEAADLLHKKGPRENPHSRTAHAEAIAPWNIV